MAESTYWEYRVISFGGVLRNPKDLDIEAVLNELGEEGWEVVGITNRENSSKMTVVAKRPLTASSRRQRSMPEGPW